MKPPAAVDPADHHAVIASLTEVVRLRNALRDRWIDAERLLSFLDNDRNGNIDYDEFYDGLSQFGLTEIVNVDKIFAYMDREGNGSVPAEVMLDILKSGGDDDKESESKKDETLEDDKNEPQEFPDTLLVGLVAHNNLKSSMMKFVKENLRFFKRVRLVTTGSTGRALTALGLEVDTLVSSGPLGGDQEIGGLISQGEVAAVFFFIDPLSAHPHQADIVALNRICCVHDTMFANNPSTAQALVYALEYSAFGFSRLTGINPNYLKKDSNIVEEYKKNQQKVISNVQAGKRASLSLGKSMRAGGAGLGRSILRAPPRASLGTSDSDKPSVSFSPQNSTKTSEEIDKRVLFANKQHTMMSDYALAAKSNDSLIEEDEGTEEFLA